MTSQQTAWGLGESLGHDVPLARWLGQLSCNHSSAWSSLSHHLPQLLWPGGASINVSFPHDDPDN